MTTSQQSTAKAKAAAKARQQPHPLGEHEPLEPHSSRHLRTPEAARLLGVSVSFLNHARIRGDGPRYRKLSPKLVVYSLEDLLAWAGSKSRCSTSGTGPSRI